MPLTRDVQETIAEEARKSAEFRRALLTEAAENLLSGELETAKAILRNTIKATIGYRALREATGIPEKSLIRMFGPSGNPRAAHLARVLEALQRHEDLRLEVRAIRRKDAA
jgi:DNA-binding phage protein